ncbi:hypothetical protein [Desulfonema magnum]|uniref:hypothetical protein n=1 Tax=Desulfonema magnum TaxID=45655 RepID=UPI001A9A987E|nr:hypothetical protein [Desulfonema magnum]
MQKLIFAISGVQKLYFCSCEKTFFALRKEHRTEPECKNCIFAVAKKHFSHSGKNTGRSRSAKIVFLQLRKNIFRTPERTPDGAGVQKLYFCSCEKTFFALRKEHRTEPECKNCIFAVAKKHFSHSGKNTGRSRSAKIVFLQYPECKNYIFAVAKKHFSHSGENTGKFVFYGFHTFNMSDPIYAAVNIMELAFSNRSINVIGTTTKMNRHIAG